MLNNAKKIIFIIIVTMLGIISITGITFAVWSNSGNQGNANGLTISIANNTSKYLVIELFDTADPNNQDKIIYVRYVDNIQNGLSGAFEFDSQSNDSFGGLIPEASTSLANYQARVIGYVGELGQFETIEIPTTIKTNINEANANAVVSVTQIAMQTPQEYPALDLIKTVRIPQSIQVLGVSFSYCKNLEKVIWLGGTPSNISSDAFRGGKEKQFIIEAI